MVFNSSFLNKVVKVWPSSSVCDEEVDLGRLSRMPVLSCFGSSKLYLATSTPIGVLSFFN